MDRTTFCYLAMVFVVFLDAARGGETEINPPNPALAGDFGFSVALDGTRGIIGDPFHSEAAQWAGAAFLFDVDDPQSMTRIVSSDIERRDSFGYAVSLSGGVALVGAPKEGSGGENSGAAYVFSTAGQELHKLVPLDHRSGDSFGLSVDIDGTRAIVGTSRSAIVFDVLSGQQVVELFPNDYNPATKFGESVGISGSIAVVGAFRDMTNGRDAGAAYLFEIPSGRQIAKLLPSDGDAFDFFGFKVAIDGVFALIGALGNDDLGDYTGSAYVFDTSTGLELTKLLPSPDCAFRFGETVAVSGRSALIGAGSNGSFVSVVHVYDLTTFQEVTKFTPSGISGSDGLARGVSISGERALVGVPLTLQEGVAFLYEAASESSYGVGWPGTLGVPELSVDAHPVLGDSVTVTLGNSSGDTTSGALFVGLAADSLVTDLGGTMLVLPTFAIPVAIPAGSLSFTTVIPDDDSFCGLDLYLQGLQLDSGASHGVSFSKGLTLHLGSWQAP